MGYRREKHRLHFVGHTFQLLYSGDIIKDSYHLSIGVDQLSPHLQVSLAG